MTGRISRAEVISSGGTNKRVLADWLSKQTLTYKSVAEAKADTVLVEGQSIKTLGYYAANDGGGASYLVRPPSYTPLAGDITLDNGNYLELEIETDNDIRRWGAIGEIGDIRKDNPTIDSGAEIQLAFDRSAVSGGNISGVTGLMFGTTIPVRFAPEGADLNNLNLTAIGGSWDSSQTVLTFGSTDIGGTKKNNTNGFGNFVNANHLAGGGIRYLGLQGSTITQNSAMRALVFQQKIGDSVVGNNANCTDTTFIDLTGSEFTFGELPDPTDYSVKTSDGLWVNGSDSTIISGVFSGCKRNGRYSDFTNCKTIGTQFFSGEVRVNSGVVSLLIEETAARSTFTTCRIDDGALVVKNFNTIFTACEQIQYQSNPLQFVATEPDEKMERFVMTNHKLPNNNNPLFTTEGAGSFGTISGNFQNVLLSNGNAASFLGVRTSLSEEFKVLDRQLKRGSGETSILNRAPAYSASSSDGRIGFHSVSSNATNAGSPNFIGAKSRSDDLTLQPITNDTLCSFLGRGSDGTNFNTNNGSGLEAVALEDWTPSSMGAGVNVLTTEVGTVTPVRSYLFTSTEFKPTSNIVRALGSQLLRWLTVWTEKINFGSSNIIDTYGSGSPEGVVTADIGSTYRRSDGGAGTSFYVKESGTGNTGWVAR